MVFLCLFFFFECVPRRAHLGHLTFERVRTEEKRCNKKKGEKKKNTRSSLFFRQMRFWWTDFMHQRSQIECYLVFLCSWSPYTLNNDQKVRKDGVGGGGGGGGNRRLLKTLPFFFFSGFIVLFFGLWAIFQRRDEEFSKWRSRRRKKKRKKFTGWERCFRFIHVIFRMNEKIFECRWWRTENRGFDSLFFCD